MDMTPYASQPLGYWHAYDEYGNPVTRIAYWNRPIKVYVTTEVSDASLTESRLRTYAYTAQSTWNTLGLSLSIVNSIYDANLIIKAVTEDTARLNGINPNLVGYTDLNDNNMTGSGVGNYQGTPKYIYEITGDVTVYLIQNSGIDSNLTSRHRVALHELSHAFGYIGHSNVSSRLMYYQAPYSTGTLSSEEIDHLEQVYSYQAG